MMSYVGSQSSNVPIPQYFCLDAAPMHDETWDVEWGNLRSRNGSMAAWQQVQHFRSSCHEAQEQYASVFRDEEAHAGEDNYESHQTASFELAPGELPSIGSKEHASGECKRCAFFSKGRCKNGKDCTHCHFPHDERRRRTRRNKKTNAAQGGDNADSEDNQDDVDAQIAQRLDAAFICMPVSMPAQDLDTTLVFGQVTPDLQTGTSCANVSSSQTITDDRDEKETCSVPAEAFSSLLNDTEKIMAKSEHPVADSEDPQKTENATKEDEKPKATSDHPIADNKKPQNSKNATKAAEKPKARSDHPIADNEDPENSKNATKEAEEPKARSEHSIADNEDPENTTKATKEVDKKDPQNTKKDTEEVEKPKVRSDHAIAVNEDPQKSKKATKGGLRPTYFTRGKVFQVNDKTQSRTVKGKPKSTRAQLLAFALGAPPVLSEEDEENVDAVKIESSVASDASAPNDPTDAKAKSFDADKLSAAVDEMEALEEEAARLEAEALAAENEAQRLLGESTAPEKDCIASDVAKERKPAANGEAETTASSTSKITSDAGATEHDFSSSDKAGQTSLSSDSDVVSDRDGNANKALSDELCSHRSERRHHQTNKQALGSTRAPKRSPLWPTRAPTVSPAVPAEEQPKKEKLSWAALARARREGAAEDPEVSVVRQARGILNKLTDANFETLYAQLLECGIRNASQLEAVIMEIFEKATIQHGFLPMYVELCVRLNSHFEKERIEGADFRKLLVAACQRTFEQNIQTRPEVDANLSYEERYEIELKFKTRMLGNLRFVGELLVRKLLAGKILLAVSEELLSIGERTDGASIEAAATLLTVAGPAFDRKSWVFLPRLHAIFSMMRCMSKDKAIPMRVRCILKDLIELREAGWQKK